MEDNEVQAMNKKERSLVETQLQVIKLCLQEGVPFSWRGPGTFLVSGRGGSAILEALIASGERIIGLDGFEFESLVIHPLMHLIYDAAIPRSDDVVSIAKSWGPDVWLDITLA
jgi:hypothetical protein